MKEVWEEELFRWCEGCLNYLRHANFRPKGNPRCKGYYWENCERFIKKLNAIQRLTFEWFCGEFTETKEYMEKIFVIVEGKFFKKEVST